MNRRTPAAIAIRPLPVTRLQGAVGPVGEALRAPASGLPCVHWRLRIFEQMAPGMELVHEVISPEPVELACQPELAEAPMRVRLAPDHARIEGVPALFRRGTAGALAVARQFGLNDSVRVEELILRPGELVEAEGVLSDPGAALSAGPFRTIDAPPELMQVTLRVEAGLSLRPVILPWALSVAAVLGSAASATAALHWLHWLDSPAHRPGLPGPPPEIGAPRAPRLRWP
jgi:hypothetical protein